MLFFVLTFTAALVSVIVPVVLMRTFAGRWHLESKIFWKAGIAGSKLNPQG